MVAKPSSWWASPARSVVALNWSGSILPIWTGLTGHAMAAQRPTRWAFRNERSKGRQVARSRVVEIWNRLLVWNQSRGAPNQRVGAPGDQLQPYGADGLMEDGPLSW